MQAEIVGLGDIFVAGVTVTIGRIANHSYVRQFFITFLAIATMADNTAYFTMGTLQKFSVLDEDLFPDLQRRQFTASTFAGGFR